MSDRSGPGRVRHLARAARLGARLRNPWLPRDQLDALQWRRTQAQLEHCWRNIPFYRELWGSHGADPTRFDSLKNLRELPPVDKAALREAQYAGTLDHPGGRRTLTLTTSGTTSEEPFEVAIDLPAYLAKVTGQLRQFYATGWRLGLRAAALFNTTHARTAPTRWREAVYRVAHRRILLPPYPDRFTGSPATPRIWYRRLASHRPALFDTFYMPLLMLLEHIERAGLEPLSIPRIFALQTLSEGARRRIEQAFSAKVFNRYSPHECEGVAFSCERQRGMHVAVDSYVLEIVDDEGRVRSPHATGRILLTDLDNTAMPLVRYETGDLGHHLEASCPCGRGFPLIGDLEGRSNGWLPGASGERVPSTRLELALQDDPGIRYFQVVKQAAKVELRVVPVRSGPLPDTLHQRWSDLLRGVLGPALPVAIRAVERLEFEPNGKFAFTRAAQVGSSGGASSRR